MSEPKKHYRTESGFVFNVATVSAICEHKGSVIIAVTTQREQLEIRVTPTGLIRTIKKAQPMSALPLYVEMGFGPLPAFPSIRGA